MKKEKYIENTYANDIKGQAKHISQVESGKKSYYCRGCGKEMIAKKGERKHHFAHDPKDVTIIGKCTYSDETYRHILAKDILQKIKQIKVPALYKLPPIGIEGKPNKIRDSHVIFAETVRNELTFYEDENGNVCHGRNINFESGSKKLHLITPDVTFFDSNNKPILIIEIVATHKPDKEKIVKIRNLGIDAVQVTIPSDSPEGIENTFFKTSRTEWLYNYERENTTYIPIPKGTHEDVLLTDEFQRKLFEATESYECRASEVRNLIRGLGKSLESEQFRNFNQRTRDEIQRVTNNTESFRFRLRDLQDNHKRAIEEEFRMAEESLGREEDEFRKRDEQFAETVREYEAKYEKFKREYRPGFHSEIDRIENKFKRLGTSPNTFGDRIEEIRREENRMEQDYRNKAKGIDICTTKERDLITEIDGTREGLPDYYIKLKERARGEFERRTSELRQKASDIERGFIEEEARVRDEFERLGRESIEAIKSRNSQRTPRINGRIKAIIEARRHIISIEQGRRSNKKYERAKEFFNSGAFKKWL